MTEQPVYDIYYLISLLKQVQERVAKNPSLLNGHVMPILSNIHYEKVQDMLYADLNPANNLAYHFSHYMQKHERCENLSFLALLNAIACLSDELLISDIGKSRYPNRVVLANHGFPTRAGEQDSFGWLSGLIQCDKFTIMYG